MILRFLLISFILPSLSVLASIPAGPDCAALQGSGTGLSSEILQLDSKVSAVAASQYFNGVVREHFRGQFYDCSELLDEGEKIKAVNKWADIVNSYRGAASPKLSDYKTILEMLEDEDFSFEDHFGAPGSSFISKVSTICVFDDIKKMHVIVAFTDYETNKSIATNPVDINTLITHPLNLSELSANGTRLFAGAGTFALSLAVRDSMLWGKGGAIELSATKTSEVFYLKRGFFRKSESYFRLDSYESFLRSLDQ